MARQSKPQRETVGRVMHEFKHGALRSAQGAKVKNPRQAIAIALNEAGASRDNSAAENKRNLARTKREERKGEAAQQEREGKAARADRGAGARASAKRKTSAGQSGRATAADSRKPAASARRAAADRKPGARSASTKVALLAEAKRRGIKGRSRMSKADLERALHA